MAKKLTHKMAPLSDALKKALGKGSSGRGGTRKPSPKPGGPLPSTSKGRATSKGKSPKTSGRPRGSGGQFVPIILSPIEEAEAQDRRDGRRLVKFSDVLDALDGIEGVEEAVEEIREALLFGDNPIVRLKLADSPMAEALGKGRSVQHRIRG